MPQRILIANWGALGDVVLSLGVIERLKSSFPHCKIGFITTPESRLVLEGNLEVDWMHTVSSWIKPGRRGLKRLLDFFQFVFFIQPQLAKEIAAMRYDWAIELRPFVPNLIPLFWKARISKRIGFTSSGNSHLLNVPVKWLYDEYLPYHYELLLQAAGVTSHSTHSLMPVLNIKKTYPLMAQKPFLIFHLCSSYERKEFPVEFWLELYQKCKDKGWRVYFTGRGQREKTVIAQVAKSRDESLCDRLTWEGFMYYIQECQGVVSVDSVPVHLAAAFRIPCAVLYRDTPWPQIWKPPFQSHTAFGLEKELNSEDVFQLIQKWMKPIKKKELVKR